MAMAGFGRGQMREPRMPPMVLSGQQPGQQQQQPVMLPGLGRGCTRIQPGTINNPPVGLTEQLQSRQTPSSQMAAAVQGPPPMSHIKRQMMNVNKPLDQHEQDKELLANFIPGLHVPGKNFPELPSAVKPDFLMPKEVPVQLIKDFKSGAKNPIMVVHEYCAILKLGIEWEEVIVNRPSAFAKFACVCKIDGVEYPQGVGSTKKAAKTDAAKIVFNHILEKGHTPAKAASGGDDGDKEDERLTDPSADPFELGLKHPVSQLHEYGAKNHLEVVVNLSDVKTDLGFRCDVLINKELICTEYASNKQDAKKKAGATAIQMLLHKDTIAKQIKPDEASHFDKMADLVLKRMGEVSRNLGFSWKTIAGFVIMRGQDDLGQVVALATGDCCAPEEKIENDGRFLIDCHAEILAHRALLKYFYSQIKLLLSAKGMHTSIFEWNESFSKLRLKESVSIHMYISTAPCGDADAFDFEEHTILSSEEAEQINAGTHPPRTDNPNYGQLRVKGNLGGSTAPVTRGSSYSVMSCSDKILKWNVLGLQGSLLSSVLEPVYMNSLTLGNRFEIGHLVRAVCCRISDELNMELPEGYSIRHPYVGRVSVYVPPSADLAPGCREMSLNWCAEDERPEIIDCRLGKSSKHSPFITGSSMASRLSKAGFNYRFRQLVRGTRWESIGGSPTYGNMKQRAAAEGSYNFAKKTFYERLQSKNFGRWVSRPGDCDGFIN